jgi:hypothetical protein
VAVCYHSFLASSELRMFVTVDPKEKCMRIIIFCWEFWSQIQGCGSCMAFVRPSLPSVLHVHRSKAHRKASVGERV